jgi:teichuronic acid biosynthesis glycosyltransferase TuaG
MLASVIMPYYRKKNYFREAYYSALNQNIKNIEIIIIYDDRDHSELNFIKNIIKNKKNTKLIVNKKQLGVGASRNAGISISKGKYICFLDCDDIWKRNKLSYQIKFMEKNFLDFTHTSYSVINQPDLQSWCTLLHVGVLAAKQSNNVPILMGNRIKWVDLHSIKNL